MEFSGLETSLKWPNDIMAGERKLGGILLEARSQGSDMSHAVLGMGINVNSAESDFPPELEGTATSLMIETGRPQEIEGMIRALTLWLGRMLAMMGEPGGPETMLRQYRASCSTLGREVRARMNGKETTGMAIDIDETGRLLLLLDEKTIPISSADIVHLR